MNNIVIVKSINKAASVAVTQSDLIESADAERCIFVIELKLLYFFAFVHQSSQNYKLKSFCKFPLCIIVFSSSLPGFK